MGPPFEHPSPYVLIAYSLALASQPQFEIPLAKRPLPLLDELDCGRAEVSIARGGHGAHRRCIDKLIGDNGTATTASWRIETPVRKNSAKPYTFSSVDAPAATPQFTNGIVTDRGSLGENDWGVSLG
jgi:hypothetical protein